MSEHPQRGEQEVREFAKVMLGKLEENRYKGVLRGNPSWALIDLREEVKELAEEISEKPPVSAGQEAYERWAERVGRECADVANYALIVAASVGALPGIDAEVEL